VQEFAQGRQGQKQTNSRSSACTYTAAVEAMFLEQTAHRGSLSPRPIHAIVELPAGGARATIFAMICLLN
jgi:hypothetical protein